MASFFKKLSHKGKLNLNVNGKESNGEAASNGVDHTTAEPVKTEACSESPINEVYKKAEEIGPMFTASCKDQWGRLWPCPPGFLERLQTDIDVHDTDVYLVTYPKCGTSWLTEVVDGILCKGDFDKVAERRKENMTKTPRLEIMVSDSDERIKAVNDLENPRFVVTHLSADLVPQKIFEKKCKTVVLMRNPKDTLVSYYHFHRMNKNFGSYEGDVQTFFNHAIGGQLFYGDMFDYQLGWWNHHKEPNVCILFYENMKKDLSGNVEKLCKFLGHSLTPEELASVVENTTFAKQKENCEQFFQHIPVFDHSVSPFFRKGEVGDWQNTLTVAQNKAMDQLIRTKLAKSGLKFQYGD